jgi:hypothetical protein
MQIGGLSAAVRLIWVFLQPFNFAMKPKFFRVGFPCFSLDSLVRIETYQWVIRDKLHQNFSRAADL